MTKCVRLDDEADHELGAAVVWYEQRLAGLGLDLLNEANDAKRRLSERPTAWALVAEVASNLKIRRCPVHGFPYSLVFIELPDHIRVLAVMHGRRRPGYWRRRIRRPKKIR